MDSTNPAVYFIAPNTEVKGWTGFDGTFGYDSNKQGNGGSLFNGKKFDAADSAVFFLGWVKYGDNFGRRHLTTFCYRYVFLNGEFDPFEKFNTADIDSNI
jgi:hypothetical protein